MTESSDKRDTAATPRTDGVVTLVEKIGLVPSEALVALARQLERELAEMRVELDDETIRANASVRSAIEAPSPVSAAILEQHEKNGKWEWPVNTVGKLISSLQTLPPQMPFHTAYFITFNDGRREARTSGPSLSRETVGGTPGKIEKFDPGNQSLVMWATAAPRPEAREGQT